MPIRTRGTTRRRQTSAASKRRAYSQLTFRRAQAAAQPNVQVAVRSSPSEMKNLLTLHDNYQPASNGSISALTLVDMGAGEHQRVGNQIRAQYLRYRIKSFGNSLNVNKHGHVQRFIMVRWKGTSQPSVTDILDDGTGSLWAGAPPQTPYNVNKRHMFDILYDRTIVLGTGNTSEGIACFLPVQKFSEGTIQLKGMPINFDGTSTAGAQNAIYLLRVGSDLAHQSYYEGVFQLFYSD